MFRIVRLPVVAGLWAAAVVAGLLAAWRSA
jgi:hypothetical protein